jgi:hypothetical protein
MHNFLIFYQTAIIQIEINSIIMFLTIPTSDSSEIDRTNIVTPTVTAVPRNETTCQFLLHFEPISAFVQTSPTSLYLQPLRRNPSQNFSTI